MEIEPTRSIRRLILPQSISSESQKPKPGPNSKNISLNNHNYTFKQYLSGSKAFSYRCTNRNRWKCLLTIPLNENFDESRELKAAVIKGFTLMNHSEECLNKVHQENYNMAEEVEIGQLKSEIEVLEKFVQQNPLLEPKLVRVEMLKQQQKFKLWQIIKVIQEIRNQVFPRDSKKVFSTLYCKALDSEDPIFNLFRGYMSIPFFNSEESCLNIYQEFVILCNNPMMMKLAASKQWFIDGTFKVAPQGFKQILNIIVYLPAFKMYYPACHIFLTHKTQDCYSMALSCLNTIGLCHKNKFVFEPQVIMCDFEDGLRNALKVAFPKARLAGCYFHFTKALWEKISKMGLRKEEFKRKSIVLISYLQILVHTHPDLKQDFFGQIKDIYANEDSRYNTFFKYFIKNWLNNNFLEELFQALEEAEDLEFIRSNNPCEIFHGFLGKYDN